jgi:hypothetical protein
MSAIESGHRILQAETDEWINTGKGTYSIHASYMYVSYLAIYYEGVGTGQTYRYTYSPPPTS